MVCYVNTIYQMQPDLSEVCFAAQKKYAIKGINIHYSLQQLGYTMISIETVKMIFGMFRNVLMTRNMNNINTNSLYETSLSIVLWALGDNDIG